MSILAKGLPAGLAVVMLSWGVAGAPTLAQEASGDRIAYPVRTVTLVTHSSPGGGSDVFLRDMSRFLTRIVDANFVVQNISGGSGANAMAHVASAPTDGSVLYATTPTYVFTSLMSNVEAGYDDLEPLVNVFYDPQVIYTRADAPFQTFEEVLEKARAGRSAWGAANPGSMERLSLEELKRLTQVSAAIVTSEGGGETMINVLNGTLDVAIGEVQELRSQLEAGQVRLLAVAAAERLGEYPDVPTLTEDGVDLVARKFRGLAGPQGLPADVVTAWESAIPRLLDDPEYKALYGGASLIPAFIPHGEYGSFTTGFAEEQRSFLTEAGIIQYARERGGGGTMGRDTVLGLIVLAFAVIYVRAANATPTSFLSDAVGAGGVPAILGWIMGGAGLMLVLQSLPRRRAVTPEEVHAPADGIFAEPVRASWKAGGVVLIALAFLLLLPIVGYIPAVTLLLAAMLAYQGAAFSSRFLFVPLLGAVVLWALFDLALGIDLPAGRLLQIF